MQAAVFSLYCSTWAAHFPFSLSNLLRISHHVDANVSDRGHRWQGRWGESLSIKDKKRQKRLEWPMAYHKNTRWKPTETNRTHPVRTSSGETFRLGNRWYFWYFWYMIYACCKYRMRFSHYNSCFSLASDCKHFLIWIGYTDSAILFCRDYCMVCCGICLPDMTGMYAEYSCHATKIEHINEVPTSCSILPKRPSLDPLS